MTACAPVNREPVVSEQITPDVSQTPQTTPTDDTEKQEEAVSPFVFEKIEGGYELKAYNGTEEAPVIPEEYLGKPVITVGDGAFANNDTISQIWFPKSITSIGNGAFKNCTALTTAMIPQTVCYVDGNAFAGCENLSIECEAGAEDAMFWSASWNPDGA